MFGGIRPAPGGGRGSVVPESCPEELNYKMNLNKLGHQNFLYAIVKLQW